MSAHTDSATAIAGIFVPSVVRVEQPWQVCAFAVEQDLEKPRVRVEKSREQYLERDERNNTNGFECSIRRVCL
jgi:hypothetical protein